MKLLGMLSLVLMLAWQTQGREVRDMDREWRFLYGDEPNAKNIGFDDSSWKRVDIPHDWGYERGFTRDGAQRDMGGYACGGIGWYRKKIVLSREDIVQKVIRLYFDGVYMNSEVWVNGRYFGKRPYGYISFSYDISDVLKEGENIIAVRCDNRLEPSARWYHPCGIYASVNLIILDETHFKQWATVVTTPKVDKAYADVLIRTELSQDSDRNQVSFQIVDAEGAIVGEAQGTHVHLRVVHPHLWSPSFPYLYRAIGTIRRDGKIIDREVVTFGIRTLEFNGQTGFWLNGVNTKIYGVAEHWEGGPVGGAWTKDLLQWKIQLLKNMGCNSIRTAHNPYPPVFYELCDSLGMLVMAEAFDGWQRKADKDYGAQAFDDWWERDLRDFVRRDRNHPSIFIWSVGNETRGEVAAELVRVCHQEDGTRPVTSGGSASELMDLLGLNGPSERKSFFSGYRPNDKMYIGTETPHTWLVRGFYRTQTWYRDGYPNRKQDPFEIPDLTENEIFGYDWASPSEKSSSKMVFNSSYDNATVRLTARHNIELARDLPWYSGNYRWTGFDYPGEAGYVHGGWPFRAFMGGVCDMAGFEKDLYYLYQSQWTDKPMIHLFPHWTHPYMEKGTKIPVWVYTTGDEAELFVNGVSFGRKRRGLRWNEMQVEWMIPFEAGEIVAVAYKDGEEIARMSQQTASQPTSLAISSNKTDLQNDNNSVAVVTIDQIDADGTLYPYGENRIYVALSDNARMISMESGNPIDTETCVGAESKRAFFGRLRAFVMATRDEGDIVMTTGVISGDKALKISDEVTIDIQEILLRGDATQEEYTVYYTTDGAPPTPKSTKYTTPFRVTAGDTVRAVVYRGAEMLFEMEERFGCRELIGEGLYWGIPGESVEHMEGEPASLGILEDCTIHTSPDNTEYITFENAGAMALWYHENDGSSRRVRVLFKYAQQVDGGSSDMLLVVNDKKVGVLTFKNVANSSKWGILVAEVDVNSGANTISLRSISAKSPCIASIQIVD